MDPRRLNQEHPWIVYVAPMFAFLLLTSLEGYLPGATDEQISPWYPGFYALKVAVVAAIAVACRSTWADLRPIPGPLDLALAVGGGVLVLALWIGLDGLYPALPFSAKRQSFNPGGLAPGARLGFLAARFFGLVLLVPLFEEIFWRSFLNRWLIDQDFAKVPVGRVTALSAGLTSAAFAFVHPEWLPALLTGLLWAGLLYRTRSLFACVVSHAVANLGLFVYSVLTDDWKYL